MREYCVAVVGATGAVGEQMLRVLEARAFPVRELRAFASARSSGRTVRFHDQQIPVQVPDGAGFAGVDFALFSAGADRSRAFAPLARQAGAIVIDNSSAFRMQDDVPLVVPEVNAHHLERHAGLIAVPNCSTIQMVLALQPLRDLFGLRRVVVSTYQSVSGAGWRSMRELDAATRAHLQGAPEPREIYPRGIAFECVPHVDVLDAEHHTREETKMRLETRKIMDLPGLPVFATCVRVPVFRCHSEAVWAQAAGAIDLGALAARMRRQPGLHVHEPGDYPLAREVEGGDDVHVGRLRRDPDDDHAVAMWVVGDNLLKGAALDAVQIAEELCGAALRSSR
jgi:aspartate-semialdehyde dehydrogenase